VLINDQAEFKIVLCSIGKVSQMTLLWTNEYNVTVLPNTVMDAPCHRSTIE